LADWTYLDFLNELIGALIQKGSCFGSSFSYGAKGRIVQQGYRHIW